MVIAAVVALFVLIVFVVRAEISKNNAYKVGNVEATDKSNYLEYNGGEYYYNKSVTSIALIGIDSTGELKTSSGYGDQPRADNITLVIFNRADKTIKLLPISRDTMTDVKTFSARGHETGTLYTHLGLAFTFGNGGKASSMNVCNSVSGLLYGAEVYRYVTTNIDSISYANKLIGGVTVTVPNNDLAFKYPEMTAGAKVQLTDANVADFLRYRDTAALGSNNGRMERQQAFLEAYIKKLAKLSKNDYVEMWDKLSNDKTKVRTNMTKNMFMKLIANIDKYSYNPSKDNLKIEGTNTVTDGYDAFYPDDEKLKKLVVDTFFVG